MIKKIFIFIFIMLFFHINGEASTTVITLRVTMPEVISANMDNEKTESLNEKPNKIVVTEETERYGKPAIVKTTVAK